MVFSVTMPSASGSAAGPPRESFTNHGPMTRCVSKASSTASFVSRIQFLNMAPPRDCPGPLRATATTTACSSPMMRYFVHCN